MHGYHNGSPIARVLSPLLKNTRIKGIPPGVHLLKRLSVPDHVVIRIWTNDLWFVA